MDAVDERARGGDEKRREGEAHLSMYNVPVEGGASVLVSGGEEG